MASCLSLNPLAEARIRSQDEGLDESSAMVWQCLCSQVCAIRSQTDFSLSFFFFPSFFGKRENNFSISFFRRIGKKKKHHSIAQNCIQNFKEWPLPKYSSTDGGNGMCYLLKHQSFRSQACPSLHQTLENGRIRSKGVLNVIRFSPGSN